MIKITLFDYREEVKLAVTGGILNLEIPDAVLDRVINSALREIQRYIDSTKLITIPYESCINLDEYNVSSVSRVFRTSSNGSSSEVGANADPMQMAQWQLLTSNIDNYQNYAYNFGAWNTILQTRNTVSTDLIFKYDKSANNLYINVSAGKPDYITIEYVPKYEDVSEITSDFWTDMLLRMSIAKTKIILGRVRSRFTQSNALWAQDGDTLLNEGTSELADLRQRLVDSTQLVYPID